jgi:sporulation protein YlmC with PRC-barrel domain
MGAPAYPMPFPPAWTPPPSVPPEVEQMWRQQDLENAVIDEGSDVYSSDGHKLGEVHSVIFDTDSGHPSRIVVRKGFLFTEDFELPASLIGSIDDGAIYLRHSRESMAHGAQAAV